jgi:hypothetical protein
MTTPVVGGMQADIENAMKDIVTVRTVLKACTFGRIPKAALTPKVW